MKFGIGFSNTVTFVTGDGAAELGTAAEDTGFESLWTVEHILYPEGYESTYPYAPDGKMPGSGDSPIPDPLIWLAYVAARTSTLNLATGISLLPERHPVTYAKEVATLDMMSKGRVILGIGIGWLREEFDALDVPWEGRTRRTEEYADVMRELWKSDDVTYHGEFINFDNISSNPKPHEGSVPIHIGGHSRAAAERAGRMGDGFFPAKGEIAELFEIARQTAADSGRDPEAIEMTSSHPGIFGDDPQAAIEEAASCGMHRMIIPGFMFLGSPADKMAPWADVIAANS
ncbi:MAG: LLM class F420-dependent oxidoreductase [Acidimicrobiales bacterium]|jgi:probable F420-dependent oxidoreductase|nr:LLM class F420-dependent oxidoreductase [Acidimicrobiales bacterium]